MRRHPQRDRIEPGAGEKRYAALRAPGQHQRQRSRPEPRRGLARALVKRGDPFGGGEIGYMDDERIEAGPSLGGEDARDGAVVGRVAAEPVDRFRRERDKLTGPQQRRGLGDRLRCGGFYRGPRPACGSTPMRPERFW